MRSQNTVHDIKHETFWHSLARRVLYTLALAVILFGLHKFLLRVAF